MNFNIRYDVKVTPTQQVLLFDILKFLEFLNGKIETTVFYIVFNIGQWDM